MDEKNHSLARGSSTVLAETQVTPYASRDLAVAMQKQGPLAHENASSNDYQSKYRLQQ
jgi:hypothetical protein